MSYPINSLKLNLINNWRKNSGHWCSNGLKRVQKEKLRRKFKQLEITLRRLSHTQRCLHTYENSENDWSFFRFVWSDLVASTIAIEATTTNRQRRLLVRSETFNVYTHRTSRHLQLIYNKVLYCSSCQLCSLLFFFCFIFNGFVRTYVCERFIY